MTFALMHAIESLDLVRAQLLTESLYRVIKMRQPLLPFDTLNPEMQQRITYVLGDRYERLRGWLSYQSQQIHCIWTISFPACLVKFYP